MGRRKQVLLLSFARLDCLESLAFDRLEVGCSTPWKSSACNGLEARGVTAYELGGMRATRPQHPVGCPGQSPPVVNGKTREDSQDAIREAKMVDLFNFLIKLHYHYGLQ